MFPVSLDLSILPVMLIGNGAKTVRRLGLLEECGALHIRIFADQPSDELIRAAGNRLVKRLPDSTDYQDVRLVMIVDIREELAIELAQLARGLHILVNVEDNKPYCDFHFPSFIKRGDFLLAVSSGGKSPSFSLTVKRWLEGVFDESLAGTLEELAAKREAWKREGLSYNAIKEHSEEWIKTHYDFPFQATDILRKTGCNRTASRNDTA